MIRTGNFSNEANHWQNDLTIGMSLKFHILAKFLSECYMIVDLAVNGKNTLSVFANKRLCSGI